MDWGFRVSGRAERQVVELSHADRAGNTRAGRTDGSERTPHATHLREIKTAGQQIGIAVLALKREGHDEIERTFVALTKRAPRAIIVRAARRHVDAPDAILRARREEPLPAMYRGGGSPRAAPLWVLA